MHATVVTCFYPTRSPETNLEWAREFMKLSAPIVLFTTKELAPIFESYRGGRHMRIICRSFEELDTWIAYEKEWKTTYECDYEKEKQSAEFYAVCACRPFFVREAIELNPFSTTKFVWCDIGAFREPMTETVRNNFPLASRLPDDRLLLQSVCSITSDDLRLSADGIIGDFSTLDRITVGLWGGTSQACRRWLAAYETMLIRYFCAGRFAGKPQSVCTSALLADPTLAHVVTCNSVGDPQFHLTGLLSDPSITPLYDPSYQLNNTNPIVSIRIHGGLGNQMFQIAAAYSHARQYGGKLVLESTKRDYDRRDLYWHSGLYRFTHCLVDRVDETSMAIHKDYSSTEYNPIHGPIPPEGLWLKGFFQTGRYFQHMNKEIQYMFRPPPWIVRTVRMRYNDWFPFRVLGPEPLKLAERLVIVHCRRTDYCSSVWNIKYHGPLPTSYYRDAMNAMISRIGDPIFILCGDDQAFWVDNMSELPALTAHEFHILDCSDMETLALFSLCNNVIMANSTFSWWGALLSGAKNVISPAAWFGPVGPKVYQDVYEPFMIRM